MHELAVFLQDIVARMGYPGVFLLVTLESTLVPVPSELVFPFAGFLASKGVFSLPVILVINSVGALVGSGIGYCHSVPFSCRPSSVRPCGDPFWSSSGTTWASTGRPSPTS